MHLSWQELRTVTLAQALERADTERTLVSQIEWDEATRQALAAARERGAQRVGVAEVVLERSAAVVARAAGRNAGVAALQQPGALLWLARGLPLLALLLGLLLDRIANAHRVDLLSPPLLAVLGWNLVIYAVLAWRARRSAAPPPRWRLCSNGCCAARPMPGRPGAKAWPHALPPTLPRTGRARRTHALPGRPPPCCTCAPPPGLRALPCRCCCAGWW